MNWRYDVPVKIHFGGLSALGEAVCGKRVLVVTGRSSMSGSGALEKALRLLKGKQARVFSGVEPNPSSETIDAGAEIARKWKADAVVGLGGGSALDSAKCIAMLCKNPGKILDYVYGKRKVARRGIEFIAIPTTSGTASEVTPFAVVTDRKKNAKKGFGHPLMYPDSAIIDPKLTLTLPKKQTASTGLDALCHAVESYWSKNSNPISDVFALEAISLVFRHLPRAYRNGKDLNAREGMSLASLFAGMAFSNTGTNALHCVSYPLTMRFGVPHGSACAASLPLFLEYNGKESERALEICRAMGAKNLKQGVLKVRRLLKSLNSPESIKCAGARKKDVRAIAEEAWRPSIAGNPRAIGKKGLEGLLAGEFKGC